MHLKAEKNKSFWMFTEPVTISLFCLLMYIYFLFSSITPLFHMTDHNYSAFCKQKQGSSKVNASLSYLYGATYFFLARFARSVFKTLIKCIVQSGTCTNP